jgi:hypothetical protein
MNDDGDRPTPMGDHEWAKYIADIEVRGYRRRLRRARLVNRWHQLRLKPLLIGAAAAVIFSVGALHILHG